MRVDELMQMFDIPFRYATLSYELSGGQQQAYAS